MLACAKARIRYCGLAMSAEHRVHIVQYVKAMLLAEMINPKSKMFNKELAVLMDDVKHPKPDSPTSNTGAKPAALAKAVKSTPKSAKAEADRPTKGKKRASNGRA